jgi:hypothetical protein
MKFLNISLISLSKLYIMKEYNKRSEKSILKVLILYFKIDKYQQQKILILILNFESYNFILKRK